MTSIEIDAGTLLASDDDTLTATYALVPYGQKCRSNLGEFSVDTGVFSYPEDLTGMSVNLDHKRELPVAGFTKIVDQADAMVATVRFAATKEGRAAYADAKDPNGKRRHISVEASGVKIKNGKATAGRVFAAGLLERPAFPGATLLAADTTEPEDTESTSSSEYTDAAGKKWTATTTRKSHSETADDGNVTTTITEKTVLSEPANPAPTEEVEPLMAAATVPNTLEHEETIEPSKLSFHQVTNLLGNVLSGHADETLMAAFAEVGAPSGDLLFAALTDIKLTTAGSVGAVSGMLQPQWLGELKKLANAKYKQKVLPLFAHDSLTSFTLNAFHWTTEFAGADWAGDKAALPSNAPATDDDTVTASRFGGAWNVAREFRDFNVPGFWAALYEQSARSYLKWADAKVLTAALAAATTLEADNPAGLDIGVGWSALIDGAAALVATGIGVPEFALVAPALYKSMLKVPAVDVLGYLNAALGLDEGEIQSFSIRPLAGLATGNVLVGVGQAATVYELPGVPIRAEGLDMTKGGIDPGLFGYLATMIEDAAGLQLVTPYTP